MKPRADGTYVVPTELVSEWKKGNQNHLLEDFKKAGLDKEPNISILFVDIMLHFKHTSWATRPIPITVYKTKLAVGCLRSELYEEDHTENFGEGYMGRGWLPQRAIHV